MILVFNFDDNPLAWLPSDSNVLRPIPMFLLTPLPPCPNPQLPAPLQIAIIGLMAQTAYTGIPLFS